MTAVRIGFVVKTFPKLSETFILGEIVGLERMGMELLIVALQRSKETLHHDQASQVRASLRYLSDDLTSTASQLKDHVRLALKSPRKYLQCLALALRSTDNDSFTTFARAVALAHTVQHAGITHLHAHFASEPANVAELAARLTGISYSISAHAKDIYTAGTAALTRKLRSARFTVTCTDCNRAHLAALAGPQADVFRMYHGIDLERFSPSHRETRNPPLILSVGRLRAKKGFATLIQACAHLRDGGVAFHCEIVGYGEDQLTLQRLINDSDLSDRVLLVGRMNHEQLIQRYRDATLFALPCQITADGDRDGIPNVLLEAMAMEVPVVTTAVSGIPEAVVHDDSGLLVPPGDPLMLALNMHRLIGDTALRARLGANGRRAVAKLFGNDNNLRLVHRLLTSAATGFEPMTESQDEQVVCARV